MEASAKKRDDVGRLRYLAAAAVFAVSLAVYLYTMAPTVTLVDSGELILASAGLGVAHPPGFPLYLILAHLASLIPLGNIAVRVHAASALFGALAAAVMTLLVVELMLTLLLHKEPRKKKKKEKQRDTGDETPASISRALVMIPAVIAGLLLAFSRTLWEYATIAEVYTLSSLLMLTILWLMFAWRREFDKELPSYRRLYFAAAVFGLAMGVHHVTTAFFLPSLALLVYTTAGRQFFTSKRILFAALISFAGLIAVYTYLPLAASRSPMMNWGEPTTFGAVWRHITGRQYQAYFDLEPDRLLDLGRFLLREWGFVWFPATLLLAIAGLVDRYRRDRRSFAFLTTVICIDVLYCIIYPISEDRDAYYLPTFIAMTLAAAYGVRWAADALPRPASMRLTPSHLAVAMLAVPILAFAANFSYSDRHRFYVAHDYVDNIFASVEPGGMVLTSDWQAYSPSFYIRDVEGERKDVVFIDINLLRRSWYFGYLDKAFPELMAASRDKVVPFREELRSWDRDPAAYDRNPALNQRINTRFQEMLQSLVLENLKTAPLYMTSELTMQNSGGDLAPLFKALEEKYQTVPQGLVFRVIDKNSDALVTPPLVNIRGLNDGTMKYADDDVVRKSVVPAYTRMLTNTGLYLLSKKMNDRAAIYLRQALAIDPTYDMAKKGLAASQASTQK